MPNKNFILFLCRTDSRNVVRQQTIGKSEEEQSDPEEFELQHEQPQPGECFKGSLCVWILLSKSCSVLITVFIALFIFNSKSLKIYHYMKGLPTIWVNFNEQ